jgi:hypothetical protein
MALHVFDVPSKRRFDLIQISLEYIRDGKTRKQLAQAISQHVRHAHFLLQNAHILGFVEREESGWTLNKYGREFLEASEKKKGLILANAMLKSQVMSFVIEHAGSIENAAEMTTKQISRLIIENTVASEDDSKGIERITAERRASSVKGWIKWLEKNMPKIIDEVEDKLVLAEEETLEFYK